MSTTAGEIRQQFIAYFVDKCGHTFVPGSPCVPHDDPTLMFANAGMNQFKDVFLGSGTRSYRRAANTQKCIRAGGKHNDLDDVGHDTYHHTFFEMLGNWSFGDYFKREAIRWAWDLLTNVWGLDKRRLHATYFGGDSTFGLEPDAEAAELWRSETDIDPEHIHAGDKKDNFWEMGDTGPCGPCSEIHIDLTPDFSGASLVNAGDPRVMEIWNLVFIQFNRRADKTLTPLPARHVDTGMGFERITAILQGKTSNYDTDIFTPIFAAIHDITGAPAYAGRLEARHPSRADQSADTNQSRDREGAGRAAVMRDVAYRVVADHVRCLTFALTDGAVPSNDGRGYVLRRILRRAVRFGRQCLGTLDPFLYRLVPAVVETMGTAFPELKQDPERIAEIVRDEEQSFGKTLDRGIALFERAAEGARKSTSARISGEDAFRLHDTFGFPIDLTQLMAEEQGLTVNGDAYERLMQAARERARAGGRSADEPFGELAPEDLPRLGTIDDSPKYDPSLCCKAIIRRLSGTLGSADVASGRASEGTDVTLQFDRTCFYAEQGGQVSDTGAVRTQTGEAEITCVVRRGKYVLHGGRVTRGYIEGGQSCEMSLSADRRATMKNHTVTHLLNWALREVLGDHVQQKGSLVDAEKTRFDFSHNTALAEETLAQVEDLVNRRIDDDLPVYTAEVDQVRARTINTLRAVFGEKYPDIVRVVSIGRPVDDLLAEPQNPEWMKCSVEFCGGTHLASAGQAGRFRLVEESAVARGIRRVTGVTADRAEAAEQAAAKLAADLSEAESRLNEEPRASARAADLTGRVADLAARLDGELLPAVDRPGLRARLSSLRDEIKRLHKKQTRAGAADIVARTDRLLAEAAEVGGCKIMCGAVGEAPVDQLRAASDSLRSRAGSAAVFLAAEHDGKVILLAAMTPDVVKRGIRAGDLIKAVAPTVGGRGGGRPDMAQGGGTDVAKIPAAAEEAAGWLRAKLESE
ncbi:MAG: alanine--tRNA ligase [Phycisphaerae bacterium]